MPITKQNQLRRVRRALVPARCASQIVLGDFNFAARGEGSHHADRRFVSSGQSTATEFDRLPPPGRGGSGFFHAPS
eukprot:4057676-Pyramimonas_sp.AAC.1